MEGLTREEIQSDITQFIGFTQVNADNLIAPSLETAEAIQLWSQTFGGIVVNAGTPEEILRALSMDATRRMHAAVTVAIELAVRLANLQGRTVRDVLDTLAADIDHALDRKYGGDSDG